VASEAEDEVADDELQRRGLQRQRSRAGHVVVGAADGDGRRTQRVDPFGKHRPQVVSEQRVGLERRVPAVLLDSSEGHHDAVAAAAEHVADFAWVIASSRPPCRGPRPPVCRMSLSGRRPRMVASRESRLSCRVVALP
jgi:hypothetical protein